MNHMDYVNIFVDNPSDMIVVLKKLNIYSNTTKIKPKYKNGIDEPETTPTYSMANHYNFKHQHGQLPVTLMPGDQYGFVVKAHPNFEEITNSNYHIPPGLRM